MLADAFVNILDLGFFRDIQAIQYKKNAKTKEELLPAVQHVFIIPTKINCSYRATPTTN
jgi:hypothetical protein